MSRHYFRKNPTRSRRPAELALDWLSQDSKSAGVLETAHQYLAAERIIADVLAGALGRDCKVAHIERQHIILAVPSPAHAAKLRQLAPTLLQALNQNGWNLNEVGVRVQASLQQSVTERSPRRVKPMDANAIEAFKALQQNLEPGALADAVAKLIKGHS